MPRMLARPNVRASANSLSGADRATAGHRSPAEAPEAAGVNPGGCAR